MTKRLGKACGTATLIIVALAAGLNVIGQEVEEKEVVGGLAFVDEVQVTVVNIDVFVRDREGNVVTGLTQDDFRLKQDGRERNLSHFAAYTQEVISEIMRQRSEVAPVMPPPNADEAVQTTLDQEDAAALAARVQPVHVVLYIDNENLRPIDRNRVLTQVRGFLREIMAPHVSVMVVSAERSVRIVQDFFVEGIHSLEKLQCLHFL